MHTENNAMQPVRLPETDLNDSHKTWQKNQQPQQCIKDISACCPADFSLSRYSIMVLSGRCWLSISSQYCSLLDFTSII